MNDEQEVKKTYKVVVDLVTTHEFEVDEVNSPEEAEDVVSQWLDEGEMGSITGQETLGFDSYPVEKEEDKFN
jgi:hypothetical protein